MSRTHRPPRPPLRAARPPSLALRGLLLAALLAACESDAKVNAAAEGIPVEEVEAEEDLLNPFDGAGEVLPEGDYAYSAVHRLPETGDTMRLDGTLVVEESGPHGIEGIWRVSQLHPEVEGAWEGEAYEITGITTYPGRLVHRVRIAEDGRVSCEAVFAWMVGTGDARRQPATCSLTPGADASAPGGLPAPRSRAVREAEPIEPGAANEVPD